MTSVSDAPNTSATGVRHEDDGTVRVLVLDRPGRRNAVGDDQRVALIAAVREAAADPHVRAIVITGAGGYFCSGGDIDAMKTDPAVSRPRMELVGRTAEALIGCPVPLVAAVAGGAYGLGFALALACDVIVVEEDATLAVAFGRLGLTADTGLSWSLTHRVGVGRARELLLRSAVLRGDEAVELGVASESCPPGASKDRALAIAHELAAGSLHAAAETKAIFAASDGRLTTALAAEADAQVRLLAGPDFTEGRAAFRERRRPRFAATDPLNHDFPDNNHSGEREDGAIL